jgi:hypothetical protein
LAAAEIRYIMTRVEVSIQRSHEGKKLTYFVLALSLLIFLFALHAKVSLYQPAGHGHSAEISKLWLNGQKMDVLNSIEDAGSFVLGLLAAVILFVFSPLFRGPRPKGRTYVVPIPFPIDSFQLCRFLRPPPLI